MQTLKVLISRKNIEDQVAALLYATGHVHDNQEIKNIEFGEMFVEDDALVPLTVTILKKQGVKIIKHNG